MGTKKIWVICGSILLVAIVIVSIVFMTQPTAQSESATKETAMLVSVQKVEKGTFTPVILATGTVRPIEDVILSSMVNGQVIKRSNRFLPGGFVEKGEVLLQIDPSDYKNNLKLRESELQQVQSDLVMEMGRQKIAEQDLDLIFGDSLSDDQKTLVLREPQLNAVKANVELAKAAIDQAKTNLDRTTIRAPFNAHVIDQNVTSGSQVAPGDNLGRLVGIESYWVTAGIPVGKLKWLTFPKSEMELGTTAKIINSSAWEEDVFRIGYLDKQIGALDNQTRLARVLIRVPDPLGLETDSINTPKMIIGSFVEAHIQAKELENVVRLDQDYLRNNETVWVMVNGELEIRKVKILLKDSEYAYIIEGLNDGELIITTNLSTVTNGVKLRTENDLEQTRKNDQTE